MAMIGRCPPVVRSLVADHGRGFHVRPFRAFARPSAPGRNGLRVARGDGFLAVVRNRDVYALAARVIQSPVFGSPGCLPPSRICRDREGEWGPRTPRILGVPRRNPRESGHHHGVKQFRLLGRLEQGRPQFRARSQRATLPCWSPEVSIMMTLCGQRRLRFDPFGQREAIDFRHLPIGDD